MFDGGLLRAAKEVLSTRTVRETIDAALREVLRVEARREEVEALSRMEGMDLDDAGTMADAWR